ncbi:hypothetical protein AZF37_09755 (plasmid) [endosymbiont 'TC1' of Trimyema compressum]|uniref:HK97 gp10 family phage protein n=1 Tax=endosymbiont 'TC1' of Trimyema compressum TaxID=243899 RepID=UPI0007F13472|nr:HK97 gp10 family phage protein [endosymbiont 'TC1' of Trimyema compressum]AMP21458.1 hypothetical protein AZF37_09755 [endosymbiont 'TC1' of Trimyema compressum]
MDNLDKIGKNMVRLAREACHKNAIITAKMLARTAPHRTGNLRASFTAQLKNKSWYVTAEKHWLFTEKGTGLRKTKKGSFKGKTKGIHYAQKTIDKLKTTFDKNINAIKK